MAKVTSTASVGVKLDMRNLPNHVQFDRVESMHIISIERGGLDDNLTDEQLAQKADKLHEASLKLVKSRVQADIRAANKGAEAGG